jgi:RND family efflux transporter MFP subunit
MGIKPTTSGATVPPSVAPGSGAFAPRGAALLAALAWMVAPGPAPAQGSGPAVPTLRVQPAGAAAGFALEGSLQPVRRATVAAQLPGTVLELPVTAGQPVRAGQVLARLDTREADATLARSDAALAQAQAEAALAAAQARRTRELQAQGFVSAAALESAQAQAGVAQAAVAAAQAGRAQAALARGFAVVTAPFDGVVQATHLDRGDLAAPGRAVATVYAPGAIRVEVEVPQGRAAAVAAAAAAARVAVELPDGRMVPPLRAGAMAAADPVAQTVQWRLELPPAAQQALLPGQAVRVHFSPESAPAPAPTPVPTAAAARTPASATAAAAAAAALRLPAAAVLQRGELTAVYVVRGEAFVLRAVRTAGAPGPQGVAVLAGLRAGERVAADAVQAGLAGARPAP